MFEGIKKVHFVGIGGMGVSALAKFFARRGFKVTGSDLHVSDITDDLKRFGIQLFLNHSVDHVSLDTELVVYSPAVPETNVERAAARDLGMIQMSYPEVLGEISKEYSTIAVCGTNGKSTTTAMLGLMLEAAGYDPTVIVGTKVSGFPDGNLRLGKGRFLVVEACEYRAHFLHIQPEMVVVTNIEEDHLDYFRDIDHIRETFQTFADKRKGKGLVVWNANDSESQKLVLDNRVSYGFETTADYEGRGRFTESGGQSFSVYRTLPEEELVGEIDLRVPGVFNVMNALSAITAALELGVPSEICQQVLSSFSGAWRRFERVGTWKGAEVISDYGHHPTAISQTIAGTREFFPGRRIILCFQPHQHARTKTLFDGFVESLPQADALIVPEIYAAVGRTEQSETISSFDLVKAIHAAHPDKYVKYARDLNEAESLLRDVIHPNDVLIIQGAGDVDLLARRLVE